MSLTRRRLLALSTTAGAGLVTAACGRTGDDVRPLPQNRLVFMVRHDPGGMTPRVWRSLSAPTLAIFGDGRVVIAEEREGHAQVPPRYLVRTVDRSGVARFAAEAEADGLVSERVDFGDPMVTDLGSTTVTLHGADGQRTAAVYGFESDRVDRHVGLLARRRRRRLRVLVARAGELGADRDAAEYVPRRVVVLEQEATSSGHAELTWPGPHPDTFLHDGPPSHGRGAVRCGSLSGNQAARVYRAARDNHGQQWLVDGTTRVLVVNALPIGLDC